ncbi:ferritin-like domain-containing protein [Pseudonocardia nigra]|jgi:rubrerythrin|uniref:ferritin-like domain-containing protein n=1 Tax=Pseudonocardia nigra TaxID=1921578 RepID=UPI001C6035E6|nr:ferritin-like domain-containing protein [Pseudonocardia nigra]
MADTPRSRRSSTLFGGAPVLTFREESDRRTFIKGAAVIGVGATFVAVTRGDPRAFAQGSASDLEILNYALTLEYLEADFYTQGLDGGILSGRELELVTPIRDHEQEHVSALTSTIQSLGGTPAEMPMFTYPEGTFTDKTMFLTAASMFEELGVDAYHGQIANVQSPEILAAAAAIAGVESRHAAILADLTGGNPFPAPFEDSKTMEQVLELAGSFIQQ